MHPLLRGFVLLLQPLVADNSSACVQTNKDASNVIDAVSELIFGELEGAKAGPFRWIFDRQLLLDVWEWLAFHAEDWMHALLVQAGTQAALDLPDAKVRPPSRAPVLPRTPASGPPDSWTHTLNLPAIAQVNKWIEIHMLREREGLYAHVGPTPSAARALNIFSPTAINQSLRSARHMLSFTKKSPRALPFAAGASASTEGANISPTVARSALKAQRTARRQLREPSDLIEEPDSEGTWINGRTPPLPGPSREKLKSSSGENDLVIEDVTDAQALAGASFSGAPPEPKRIDSAI